MDDTARANAAERKFRAGARVVGGVWVLVGVMLEEVETDLVVAPIPEPTTKIVGLACLVTGLAIEVGVEWVEYNEATAKLESVTKDTGLAEVPYGSPIQPEGPDGGTPGGGAGAAGLYYEGEPSGDVGSGPEGGGCFVADTLVLRDVGFRPIAETTVGDTVMAPITVGACDSKAFPVTCLHVHTSRDLLDLRFDSGHTIRTTARQQFFRAGVGFVPAYTLEPGNELTAHGGKTVCLVEAVNRGELESEVFNLSVARTQTYFVGEDRLLVHNDKRAGTEEPNWEDD